MTESTAARQQTPFLFQHAIYFHTVLDSKLIGKYQCPCTYMSAGLKKAIQLLQNSNTTQHTQQQPLASDSSVYSKSIVFKHRYILGVFFLSVHFYFFPSITFCLVFKPPQNVYLGLDLHELVGVDLCIDGKKSLVGKLKCSGEHTVQGRVICRAEDCYCTSHR